MGGVCSRQKSVRVIIQGLDAAGKTTLLYRLKLGEVVTTIPTIGFNVETISHGGMEIVGWDLGGRDKIRPLYRHYYAGSEGFIYIIDSADVDRIDEAIDELNTMILKNEEVQNSVVMVVANKQDLENSVGPEKIESKIKETYTLGLGLSLFVMPCSVTTGQGLQFAFDHFVKLVKMKKDGKLQAGLIPLAWETANQKEDSNVKPKTDDDVTSKEKERDASSGMFHRIKNSVLKDPLSLLKSVLFY